MPRDWMGCWNGDGSLFVPRIAQLVQFRSTTCSTLRQSDAEPVHPVPGQWLAVIMDTRLLKMFCGVAQHGGLAVVARELELTPSAVSHGLRALEEELGCRLFERVGQKMVLNQAGEHLLSVVREPLTILEGAAESVRELGRWGEGRLRIGVAVSACQHILPPVLAQMRKAHPRLRLLVETGDMPHLATLLREHKIELAVGVEPAFAPDLELRPLFEDELLYVLSPGHPWNDGRALTREEVRQETLILYRRSSPTAELIEAHLRELQLAPAAMMEVASITAIKEMVKLNLGIGVLAPWTVETELVRRTLRMRPLGSRMLRRRWAVAHLGRRRLGMVEETFCRLLLRHAAGLRKDRKDLPAPR